MSIDYAQAAQAAQQGIEQAGEHANKMFANWVEEAAEALGWAANQYPFGKEFTVEQLRQLCHQLPEPPDLRSWGAATQRARRLGYIVNTGGFAEAASSNNSPKPLYRAGVWR